MLNSSLFSSDKDDWQTPQSLFDDLNAEFNFTLDPCCWPHSAKCDNFFTPDDDGLMQDWIGTVFMNPPYGRQIGNWIAKARTESVKNNSTVVCLVPARTDTRWWHDHCMKASEIRLCTRRLTFEGASNKATFPAAIIVFRPGDTTPKLSAQIV